MRYSTDREPKNIIWGGMRLNLQNGYASNKDGVRQSAREAIATLAMTNSAIDSKKPNFWSNSYRGFDDEERYNDDLDTYLNTFLPDALRAAIKKITEYSSLITAEDMMSEEVELWKLDVAFIFILRLACGKNLMTHDVLQKVRSSWCRVDLPDSLYSLLFIRDDAQLKQELSNYKFDGQLKTACLVKHNLLSSL